MPQSIVFLSDYGLDDEFVGTCHGVIARIAPESRVIDLTHVVPPHDVRRGALVLAQSIPYMPEDAIFLAVVDPGVGSERRSIAVETSQGRMLVGPDNGLLAPSWERLGGVADVVEITSSEVVLQPLSATFHGRDVFAPASAHLAIGTALSTLGARIDPSSLTGLPTLPVRAHNGELHAEVLAVDRFGNLELTARPEDLAAAGLATADELEARWSGGHATTLRRAATFADAPEGDLALFIDSGGWVAIAVNGGSAAEALGVGPGDAVVIAGPDR
jgi:S-adenosyl-L-methionine hydrolase (adenosine-forming)